MYAFDRKTFDSTRDALQHGIGPQPQFRVTLTFVLEDGIALWSAARAHMLEDGETTDEMVHETIGPPEAPVIADCLAVLCDPAAFLRSTPVPGCEPNDFWVDVIPGLPDYAALETR